jgi:hypothetical protein
VKITFEAAELPEDHPEKYNDRSASWAKRWWEVTVIDDDGNEFHSTAQWRGPHDLHHEIHQATRPKRLSEIVMGALAQQEKVIP